MTEKFIEIVSDSPPRTRLVNTRYISKVERYLDRITLVTLNDGSEIDSFETYEEFKKRLMEALK